MTPFCDDVTLRNIIDPWPTIGVLMGQAIVIVDTVVDLVLTLLVGDMYLALAGSIHRGVTTLSCRIRKLVTTESNGRG